MQVVDVSRPCPSCRQSLPRAAFLRQHPDGRVTETQLCAECNQTPANRHRVKRLRQREPLGYPCMSCSRVRPMTEFEALPGRVRRRVPTTCRSCIDKLVAQLVARGFAAERECRGCSETHPLRAFVRAGRADVDPRCSLCRLAGRRAIKAAHVARVGKTVYRKKATDTDWLQRAQDALYPGVSYDQLSYVDRTRVYLLCVEMMRDAQLWPVHNATETPAQEGDRLGKLYQLVHLHDRRVGRPYLADVIDDLARMQRMLLSVAPIPALANAA